jgi:glucosamine--fructose-6-phosphate aminotransferase (isomerizing)
MDTKQAILDTPRALREMLEKRRPEYEALIRRTRWGDGPLFIVGQGPSRFAGMTAGLGFESLVGWPAVVREATEFCAYALGVLQPRSVVLAISQSGENPETLEAARAAHARGATVLALTNTAQNSLAALADGIFLTGGGGEAGSNEAPAVCRHAAMGFIPLLAAQVLKRHHPQLAALESEFQKLPEHIEWALTQLSDAVRPFAAELKRCQSLRVLGAGFFHPIAAEWARELSRGAHIRAECAFPFEEELDGFLEPAGGGALVFISNSRCRLKRAVHKAAARAERAGIKSLTITDREDRELQKHSSLAILLPGLHEMTGADLALALLEWASYHAAQERISESRRARPRPRPG